MGNTVYRRFGLSAYGMPSPAMTGSGVAASRRRERWPFSAFTLVAVLTLSGCKPPEAATLATLSVDFTWDGTVRCTTRPPAFQIGGVPANTKTLDFIMRAGGGTGSLQGGGQVAYAGSGAIPAGAFVYLGPCPLGVQNYRFTVQALDASGTVIARGQAARPFPP